ncbi:MAG: CcoQ/FixQ family Cbb3-type cytochrome c oxidase assembly chaperone [Bdellovibrionales bacterium]|nr:CcoQ/FixQ family Cbb3-type cytochrome c oxidase assembly chaperone [Bdellovibrionales bacterium]
MSYLVPQFESLPFWPTVSGAVFFALFAGIVWWIYRGDRKSVYQAVEKLPLDD